MIITYDQLSTILIKKAKAIMGKDIGIGYEKGKNDLFGGPTTIIHSEDREIETGFSGKSLNIDIPDDGGRIIAGLEYAIRIFPNRIEQSHTMDSYPQERLVLGYNPKPKKGHCRDSITFDPSSSQILSVEHWYGIIQPEDFASFTGENQTLDVAQLEELIEKFVQKCYQHRKTASER